MTILSSAPLISLAFDLGDLSDFIACMVLGMEYGSAQFSWSLDTSPGLPVLMSFTVSVDVKQH